MSYREHFDHLGVVASQYGKEKDYWLNKLSGDLGGRNFPYDGRDSAGQRQMCILPFEISGQLFSKLMHIVNRSDIRLHMLLTAGIFVLLYKYTDNSDLSVGIPIYKQKVRGDYTNTAVVLKQQFHDKTTFKELVILTRQVITEALENANYPLETLLYHLNLPSSQGNFPLFDVAILLENIHDKTYLQHIPNNMTFSFNRTDDRLEVVLEYNASLFEKTTAEGIVRHFSHLLQEIVFNVDLPVSSLNMLPGEEKQRLLNDFTKKMDFCRDKTIYQLFEIHAQKNPDQVAVVFEGKEITYGELNEHSNQLARVLTGYGLKEDKGVGILLDRSPLMVECILAVWKAGGAYIPIDTQNPGPRIEKILNDSSARILLTREELLYKEIEERYAGKIVKLDKERDRIRKNSALNLDVKTNMNSLAYVIYTSGSTGNPKGVMIEHIGMMNHMHAKVRDLGLSGKSVVAQNASHTFDISVWQFFVALVLGGKTVIYSDELVMEPDGFLHRLIEDQATILEVVPSYLSVMLESMGAQVKQLQHLRFLLVTGETLKPALLKKWFEKYPGIKVVNAYGPTEASDDITHHVMDKNPHRESITIGKPLQNLNIYVVDRKMNLCPVGVKGEICVSGIGVGRGYLNDPGKTHQAFMEDPFQGKPGTRLYKTGDFGCWRADGTIEFFGRKDYQVKIRGFRIELAEIENKILNYPKVKEAVVIVHEEKSGVKDVESDNGNESLCAYVVTEDSLDFSGLKAYLGKHLPNYCVPTHFVKLERLPLTPNGKVERKALPAPGLTRDSSLEIPLITEKTLKNIVIKPGKTPVDKGMLMGDKDREYVLSREERERTLYSFNDTAVEYPRDKLPHQLIEEQVERTPNNVAIVHRGHQVTYRKINEKANQLARLLRGIGVKSNYLAAIMTHRQPGLIIGILSILKAGGAYVPIELENPPDRKKYMLEFSGVDLLLTNKKNKGLSSFIPTVIDLEDNENYKGEISNLSVINTPTDLVHVIFTSGTTGTPKGVMIENRSLVNLIKGVTDLIRVDEKDIFLSVIPVSFDMFGSETILPLTKGSKIVLGTQKEQNELGPTALAIERECTTIYQVTPSYLQFLVGDENAKGRLKHLRYLISAGEAFPKAVRDMAGKVVGGKIFNFYGPTEATIFSTAKDVTGDNLLNIGKPIANTRIYILSSTGKLLPVGVPGELCIGGDGVAKGYLRRDDLTEEKFIKNPFVKGDRLYKTGDLARWLPDGEIEYLGRIDHQVQIRGIRVEPDEIESTLLRHNDINEAVVVGRETRRGYQELCAFLVSNKRIIEGELRKYLLAELPLYMLPSYFLQLEKLPLTPNGKVNRRLLESINLQEEAYFKCEPPKSAAEEKIAQIWRQVLGREAIGINENFFMIGGDSIKIIQIASRMKKAGYKIEMKDIFENPTIAQLAPLLKKSQQTDLTAAQSTVTGIVPLVPAQKAFFSSQPIDPHYFNMSVMIFSKVPLEDEALRAIFKKIQEHHDTLRMTFENSNGGFLQINHGLEYPLSLQVFDLRNMAREKSTEIIEQKANEIQASINMEEGPLMKLGLFRLHDEDRLLIVIHHLVMDGVSWRILLEDINTLYRQYENKETLQLPLKSDSFKVWAEQLSKYANSESFLEEKEYWKALESKIVPRIEKDFTEDTNFEKDSETLTFRLSAEDTEFLLTKVNAPFATETSDILLTALGLTVRHAFGIERVLVALEGHGREEIFKDIDVKRTIGWFTSVYPIILEMVYENDLAREIKKIKETLRQVPHRGIGYGILKYLTREEYREEIDFRLTPQISFNYLGQFDEDSRQRSIGLASQWMGSNHSKNGLRGYEIEIIAIVINNRMEISMTFNNKQFKREKMKLFFTHLESELTRIIDFCSHRQEKELTPSDLGYKELTIEQLDSLFEN